ncbi:MAG: o-succinylbenzoate--CoA ligase [Anaerolinea sp.]|nr:o-succinylbenzoate--CoA ligase [Anaerolinea sp.]
MPDWVGHRAAVLPTHPAVVTPERAVTYAELDKLAGEVGAALLERGVAAGDRVALLALNSLEFAVAVHGITRIGAILVPLNARLTPQELAWQLGDSGSRTLLFHAPTRGAALLAATEGGLPFTSLLSLDDPPVAGEAISAVAHSDDDAHSIIYTSGTTGRPKGAILTYSNFWNSAAASAFNMGVLPNDRWLACLPLFHVGGLSVLLRSAIYGTTAVIHGGFDETAVNRALRHEGVSLLSVVPTMLQRMLDADDAPYPPSLRGVLVGGGPVTREILERALARGLPVLQTYGLSEAASQVTTLSLADTAAHAGSAGKPLVCTQLRIDAEPGQPGEILVSGPTVTPGYFGNPEATARTIQDGWLHTGDIGRLDEDGFLYVLDRRDDLIVSGGENVYPAEVEAVLLQHPLILAAAVVGLPDERWGQVVAAAVVVRPGFDAGEATVWLRERVAGYKVPRRFVTVDTLPATASGKVQRHLARTMFI